VRNCIFSEYFTGITDNGCPTDSHFLCSDNMTCIPYHHVCDISPDCPDETDETENCCKYNFIFQQLLALHFSMYYIFFVEEHDTKIVSSKLQFSFLGLSVDIIAGTVKSKTSKALEKTIKKLMFI